MVKRFASGDSELKQSEAGRFRRGAPRLTPQKSTAAPQTKVGPSKKEQIEQRAQEIAIEAVERKLQGKRISFFVNKGDQSVEAQARNRAKDIYKELVKRRDIAPLVQEAAEQKIRAQELGFGQNVEEFRSAQGFAQPRGRQFVDQQKQTVTDLEGGGFAVTKRDASGQEVTRFFDKEGKEVQAQSGIGLSPRQAVARDFFIKTGVLKEKDKPTNFGEVRPLPVTILQAEPTKTEQFATGDLIIENIRAPTPRQRFDFTQEFGLSTSQIIAQRFKQVGVGVTQAGISVTEGLGTIAVNFNPRLDAPTTNIAGVPVATRFRLEDLNVSERTKAFVVDIKQAPRGTGTFLGKSLVFAPLIGSSVAATTVNIQSLGLREGLKTTVASFSPLRIKPGTFGPLEGPKASKVRFNAVAVTKTKGATTTRIVTGKDTQRLGANLISRQQFAKVKGVDIGAARTTITSKTFTITPGGSLVQGQRIITTDSAIVGKVGTVKGIGRSGGFVATTKGLPVGFSARVASITRADLLLTNSKSFGTFNVGPTKSKEITVGGFSKKLPGKDITFFAAGKATRFLKLSPTKLNKVVRVSNFQIRGIELKAPSSSKSFTGGSTQKLTPPKTIVQQSAQLTAAALNVKPSAASPKGTTQIPPTINLAKPSQRIAQSQQPKIRQSQEVKLNQLPKLDVKLQSSQAQRSRTITTPSLQSVSATLQTPRVTPALQTSPAQSQRSRTRQSLRLSTLQVSPPTSQIPPLATPSQKPIPAFGPLIFAKQRTSRGPKPPSIVEVRRGGVFRPVARAPTPRQAIRLGALITGTTLAASFRIKTPQPTKLVTPRGFRRKREEGNTIFIERRGLRLSKPGEIAAIQASKLNLPSLKL